MRRCAIAINGHNHPVAAVNAYVNGNPNNINDLNIDDIPNLYAFLWHLNIISKDLPHVDKLMPIQQVNLAIFDCTVRLPDTQNASIIPTITIELRALEDLANRLGQDQDLSTEQQAFITAIRSGGGNGRYWARFMEVKCAVAMVELGM
ncbi:hypothetical protein FCOIX_13506 [Fusarium coicis]|nr:hypothetical protein FCOIX_13506 [Fusarium coicis]